MRVVVAGICNMHLGGTLTTLKKQTFTYVLLFYIYLVGKSILQAQKATGSAGPLTGKVTGPRQMLLAQIKRKLP